MLSNVKMVIYFRYDQILETALLKALSRKSSKSYGQDKLPFLHYLTSCPVLHICRLYPMLVVVSLLIFETLLIFSKIEMSKVNNKSKFTYWRKDYG